METPCISGSARFTIHHTAIAVTDLAASAQAYGILGFQSSGKVVDPVQKVEVVLLRCGNEPGIELVKPIGEDSPVSGFLSRNGPGPYHICYEVDDLDSAITLLRRNGFVQVSDLCPAQAFDGRRICFLFNRDMGLVELLEMKT